MTDDVYVANTISLNSDYPTSKGDIVIINRRTITVHGTIDSRRGLPSVDDLGEDLVPYTSQTFSRVFSAGN